MPAPVFPVWAIVLDVFGTLLVAGGVFVLASDGEVAGIQVAELRGPAIAMLVVGGMLMVPLVVSVIKRVNVGR